ncbi:entry exclusion lipoprotein TrbK [Variovorax sp. LARHSF232]
MKNLLLIISATAALVLAGCGKSEPTHSAIESVESPVGNPERLRELRALCKADHAGVGDAQCNAAAEAMRRRFMRGDKSPYASDPVQPPAAPASPPTGAGLKD